MKNFLQTILAKKREEVRARKKKVPVERLKNYDLFQRSPQSLRSAILRANPAIIAEIKKASPSKGVLRRDFDHRLIARQYADGGATALSVLTDREFFQGDISYLEDVAGIVSVPLLRKDFIIDAYQLHESKAYGADAVLLIAAALDKEHLFELHAQANELGLECLVEIHSEQDAAKIEGLNAHLIGINHRDLETFDVDLGTTARLRNLLPPNVVMISESGIRGPQDVVLLRKLGIHGALVGELFMRSFDPGAALKDFFEGVRHST